MEYIVLEGQGIMGIAPRAYLKKVMASDKIKWQNKKKFANLYNKKQIPAEDSPEMAHLNDIPAPGRASAYYKGVAKSIDDKIVKTDQAMLHVDRVAKNYLENPRAQEKRIALMKVVKGLGFAVGSIGTLGIMSIPVFIGDDIGEALGLLESGNDLTASELEKIKNAVENGQNVMKNYIAQLAELRDEIVDALMSGLGQEEKNGKKDNTAMLLVGGLAIGALVWALSS